MGTEMCIKFKKGYYFCYSTVKSNKTGSISYCSFKTRQFSLLMSPTETITCISAPEAITSILSELGGLAKNGLIAEKF